MSIFDFRRYNGSYLLLRPPSNEICCFHWWIGRKKKSIPGNTGVLKSYLKLQEKDYLNSNIYIFVNIRFNRTSIIIKSFKGNNFVQFRISSILYMYKNLPEAILLVNFGLFGENFQLLVLFTRK